MANSARKSVVFDPNSVAALNSCDDGAYIEPDIKSAYDLVEVCDQAIHTEEGHGV